MGVVLVLAHVAFRAWALVPSWFYLDDYNLLYDTTTGRWGLDYLLEPHNSNLMPGGRAAAWLVAESGTLDWNLAAGLVLLVQAIAAAAALWALLSLFGARWGVIAPLALYLTSAMTLPAMMWWTAALNQVPLQAALFLALGAWVRHLRTRKVVWLVATLVATAVGLFFYVKALLFFPVLAFVALAWFATGGPLRRLLHVARTYWLAAVAGLVVAVLYLAYYVLAVDAPFTETSPGIVGRISETMLGTAFMTGVLGGPWSWDPRAPPNAFADPPDITVHLAWVVVVLTVVFGVLTRRRTLRAWFLLAAYLICCLALLVNSRGPEYGAIIGLEYRYLTDAAAIAAVCVGLAFLELPGAPGSSVPRVPSLLRVQLRPPLVAGLVALVALGGMASSVRYVTYWHTLNESDPWIHALDGDLRRLGRVDLADTAVPEGVISAVFAPDNALSKMTPLLHGTVDFPRASSRLGVVAEDGTVRAATIGSGVRSEEGPARGCGWKVGAAGRSIPLTGRAFAWDWWVRLGYLYSDESPVTVSAGGDEVETTLLPGLNSLYVRLSGSFDEIRIDGLAPGSTLCVDTVEVGQVEAGSPMS
ncbi:hypothetical protein [Nocardioides sp. P5_C9_2]